MPCNDSSSGLNIKLDQDEKLIKFEFAKITCSSEIGGNTGYSDYCRGKTLEEILTHTFPELVTGLNLTEDEERQFVLYLEWDALRSGIVQYLGLDKEGVDKDRCQITSIEYGDEGIEIAEVILPPKELPKILPCSLGEQQNFEL